MKKNISMVLMGMVALCACTKQVKFKPENATLYAGDSIQVSVENAGATPKLLSENTFVATVGETSGWIKARHVGETNVYCDYDANNTAAENVAKCKVTVQPRYTYYAEPLTDWTLTKEQLIEKLGEPTRDDVENGDGYLSYGDITKDEFIMVYAIGDGRLYRAFLLHKKLTMKEVQPFLSERYAPVPDSESDFTVVFMNADNEDDATMYVMAQEHATNYVDDPILVTYTYAGDEGL